MPKLLVIANVATSTFYRVVKKLNDPDRDLDAKMLILSVYNEHKGRYGSPKIRAELSRRGIIMNHKKVERIMNLLGISARKKVKKYKSYKGEVNKICDNLLVDRDEDNKIITRNFATTNINQKWVTDVTQFNLFGHKIYLSPIMDLFNSEIISYNISTSPNYNQIIKMLNGAFKKVDNLEGLIFHSDQGWQYQMEVYRETLKSKKIIQSMSRKGNCLDNSIMENFFGLLKNEMFYGYEKTFTDVNHLISEIKKYIKYYNEKRIMKKLNWNSPIEYKEMFKQQ